MFPTFKFTDPQLDGALTNSNYITTNDSISSWLFIHAYFVQNGCILVELCDFKVSRCICPVLRLTFTKTSNSIYLILRVPTPCFQHCSNTPRHALNQVDTNLHRNIVPLDFYALPQLINAGGLGVICSEPSLEVLPQMLNWVEVRRLRWPFQHLDTVVFKPFSSDFERYARCVWGRCLVGK